MGKSRSPFHRGEREIQARLGVQDKIENLGRRMIQDHMLAEHREFLSQQPLLFAGTIDESGRPWASVLAGQQGFLQSTDESTLTVGALPIYGDVLRTTLIEGAHIGALGLDFETRDRVRVNGRVAKVSEGGVEVDVVQSFGNCPKYIQARQLVELDQALDEVGKRKPVRRGEALNNAEAVLVAGADTFFIASQYSEGEDDWTHGVDISHRGGKPGFVIVAHQSELLFPDYAGNCMFNTLGNILVNPRCGLLFLDFETGDTLQLTGEAVILWEPHHAVRFPGANQVVSFHIQETCHIERALPLSWHFKSFSPVFDRSYEFDTGGSSEAGRDMRLLSVNVSRPREIIHDGKTVVTGIGKRPVEDSVMLRRLNLDGDGQADLWGHGGAFRAVYVCSRENYEYWSSELGRDDLRYGLFGENFTVEAMPDDEVCVGDVYRLGEALIEVTQPRIPCYKLAIQMGIEGFQNRFLKSGRVGFYCRVLEEGEVSHGEPIELVSRDTRGLTVTEVSNLLYFDTQNLEMTRKALSIPALSHGWKGSFEERLAKAETQTNRGLGFREMVVDRKIQESETITSFYLKSEDGKALTEFAPGQFLTFELDIPGQSETLLRTYSLSDGFNPDYYRVSIKREPPPADQPEAPPGRSSTYFHDHVEIGTSLRVGPPRGKFRLDQESQRPVVLLSAGVGLTPMIAMMNMLIQSDSERTVWFVHGARNGREHAMGDHVREMAAAIESLHVYIVYSSPDSGDSEGHDFDSQGRIDVDLLRGLLPFDNYEFYLCGPPPFMKSLYCGLLSLDVSETAIHYEFFGPATALTDDAGPCGPAVTRTVEQEVAGEIQVTFNRSGVSATWDPSCETILDLAEKHGLTPDYSCRSGICNTCMCELIDGEVEYVDEPLSTPDPGNALICCSRPMGNIVIDI